MPHPLPDQAKHVETPPAPWHRIFQKVIRMNSFFQQQQQQNPWHPADREWALEGRS
jgi:hypothetical protein